MSQKRLSTRPLSTMFNHNLLKNIIKLHCITLFSDFFLTPSAAYNHSPSTYRFLNILNCQKPKVSKQGVTIYLLPFNAFNHVNNLIIA
jgi:hypothetical protein